MGVERFDQPWFAVQTRLRYEDFAAKQLRGRGFEPFLPVYRSSRRWSDRTKEFELPLFPGYLFCRFNPANRLPVLTAPGVVKVVGVGKTPIPVEESEIAGIYGAIENNLKRQPWPFLRAGQKVRITCGPLAGLDGILVNARGSSRIVLSVSLLQRSVAVELDSAWVTSVQQKSQSAMGAPLLPAA